MTMDPSAITFSQWHVQPSAVHSQTDVHTLTHIAMFGNFLLSLLVYEKIFSNYLSSKNYYRVILKDVKFPLSNVQLSNQRSLS